MKVSLQWVNRYLEPAVDANEAARLLGVGGFPVEHTEPVGGGDTMLDVEVTSNRSDVLSHLGVAREIAARSERGLKAPAWELPTPGSGAIGPDVSTLATVVNDAPDLCPLYTARIITGVKIGPSPGWLVQALQAVGQRPVNNVVDITNYVLLELGQPLHAFDLNKLAEKKIVVRKAAPGEAFEAIDHSKHKLHDDMLVIADGRAPVALAGVMGGSESEVTGATKDLLIESAVFDELTVRRASRRLKLFSDSCFRFERGVDPLGVDVASRRCCALIVELAGGTLAAGVIRVGRDDPKPTTIRLRSGRTRDLLGIELDPHTQGKLLGALGIATLIQGDTLIATVPSYRLDLTREVDLIEEIARQHGLANIPTRTKINIVAHHPQPKVQAKRAIVESLVAHGYHETVTPSLVTADDAGAFVDQAQAAVLVGDTRRADNTLRPSPLPSLLRCRKLNQDAGNRAVKLFELAGGWRKDGDGRIQERRRLTLLRDAEDAQQALREVRGTIEELLEAMAGEKLGEAGLAINPVDDGDYRVAASVVLSGKPLGVYGLVADGIVDRFGLQVQVVAAQLDLEPLLSLYPPTHHAGELPRYPAIERDLSVVVDEATAWQQIAEAVHAARPALLESTSFVGTYRGKQVGSGKKSVTLRMQFRDPATTLRHDQVDPQVDAVVKRLSDKVGAALRA